MRIASLVPSATEMLFALGLGGDVVGVTHECDYPPAASELPHLTATVLSDGLSAGEIDAAVKAVVGEGRALYSLDEERLAELAPELIVTQAVCDVCAVSFEDVAEVAARLPGQPRVLRQDPSSLGEVLEDVTRLGAAAGIEQRALELRGELEARLAAVRAAVAGALPPRVVALEWLDPPFVGGHWIPEMVAFAGGVDVAGPAGAKSPEVEWEALAALAPDLVVIMPCGMYAAESRREAEAHWKRIESLGAARVFAVDAASTYSRPGPRLVDGTELLAHLLHPDRVAPHPASPSRRCTRLVAVSSGSSSTVRFVSVCAAALAVFVLWLAIGTASHAGIGFFYAIPVGLATWWFGARIGAGTALICCALYTLGAQLDAVDGFALALTVRAIAFALVVVVVSVLRERVIVLEHSSEELEAIRAALTPSTLPELPGVDAGAAFVASEYGVSGDFYLLTNGPDNSTIAVVGDVVGHGPKAARLATFIRARFAAFAANTSDPAEILTLANAALVERPGRDEELVSAVCLRFQAEDSRLSYAVAGHPLPMHLPSLDELRPEGGTLLLGVSAELPLETADLTLDRSHGVLVYTDGATDVQQGEARLGSDGLSRLLGPLVRLPARVLAREAHKAVLGWADTPLGDDLCILVLRPRA